MVVYSVTKTEEEEDKKNLRNFATRMKWKFFRNIYIWLNLFNSIFVKRSNPILSLEYFFSFLFYFDLFVAEAALAITW